MDVLTRDQWGARPPNRAYVTIDWDDRPGLETHHSVGIYGTDTAAAFARAVQDDHLGRDWTDTFYNYLIWLGGQIIEGRPDHAKSGPISYLTVCFAGNYDTRQPTDRQKESWHQIRDYLNSKTAARSVAWHGQRDQVACPGANVIGWLKSGYPRPEQPQEEDVNALPLVKKAGDDRVWVAVGKARTHLQDWEWELMDPRAASKIVTLPDDHEFWSYPVLEDDLDGAPHEHGFKVEGTTSRA